MKSSGVARFPSKSAALSNPRPRLILEPLPREVSLTLLASDGTLSKQRRVPTLARILDPDDYQYHTADVGEVHAYQSEQCRRHTNDRRVDISNTEQPSRKTENDYLYRMLQRHPLPAPGDPIGYALKALKKGKCNRLRRVNKDEDGNGYAELDCPDVVYI